MKLYGVGNDNQFKEYEPQRFKDEHREEMIETWLEQNSKCITDNGGLLIIGRQVTTNLNSVIDLLGLDRDGNVAVIELKRDKTPRDVLAQALEYASFAAKLSGDQLEEIYMDYLEDENANLADDHNRFFALMDESISFNKNQRVVIVGSEITEPVRQSATYLGQKGILVSCLEFSYFQAGSGEQLLTMDMVVSQEPAVIGKITSVSLPKTTELKFLANCDDAGREIFQPLLKMAHSEKLSFHWGARGFTINVSVDGSDIVFCYGYPLPNMANQQIQCVTGTFEYILKKLDGSEDLVDKYKQKFEETGLFHVSGKYGYKFVIQKMPTPQQVKIVTDLFHDFMNDIKSFANSIEK